MFGLIKENILTGLEDIYNQGNKKEFKKGFANFTKIIKESKDIKGLFELYHLANNTKFDNDILAKEFIDECLVYANKYDKSKISLLKDISTDITINENRNTTDYCLDQLIFNENISLTNKLKVRSNFIKLLTNKVTSKDINESIKKLGDSLNDKMTQLTEEQIKIVNLLAEGNETDINEYYKGVISETSSIIDDKIVITEDTTTIKKLIEVKKKLNKLSKDAPNVDNIDSIIELKNSLV